MMTARMWLTGFGLFFAAVIVNAQTGPWEGYILFHRSTDGVSFKSEQVLTSRAGVSTVARMPDGRLIAGFQWFPIDDEKHYDRIAVAFSRDEGLTWSLPQPVTFINLPSNITRQFDPTLLALPDGRMRLYFTGNPDSSRTLNSSIGIYSAFTTDGVHFTYEPGERFGVDDAPVIDCAAAILNGKFHLFSPVQETDGKAYHAVSDDGLNFTRQDDLDAGAGVNWLGCVVAVDGGLRFFGTAAPQSSFNGVWSSFSSDGFTWTAPQSLGATGADPGVVYLNGGGMLITFTGKPQSSFRAFERYR
ncbi:MAG: hypothetical protein GC154_11260 [bacterium]|nr:hypothetical protein [bacterium]